MNKFIRNMRDVINTFIEWSYMLACLHPDAVGKLFRLLGIEKGKLCHAHNSGGHWASTVDALNVEHSIANHVLFAAGDMVTYGEAADLASEEVLGKRLNREVLTVPHLHVQLAAAPTIPWRNTTRSLRKTGESSGP